MEILSEEIEVWKTKLEIMMMGLTPTDNKSEHRNYLSGYINCLLEMRHISEETHDYLSIIYAI